MLSGVVGSLVGSSKNDVGGLVSLKAARRKEEKSALENAEVERSRRSETHSSLDDSGKTLLGDGEEGVPVSSSSNGVNLAERGRRE